jgi:hypothetical protein
MAEYDRQRTKEDRGLVRTVSRAWHFLFWMLLTGVMLWNAPFLPWIGILKLAGLMIGLAVLHGGSGGCDALTAYLKLVETTRPQRPEGYPQPRRELQRGWRPRTEGGPQGRGPTQRNKGFHHRIAGLAGPSESTVTPFRLAQTPSQTARGVSSKTNARMKAFRLALVDLPPRGEVVVFRHNGRLKTSKGTRVG